VPAEQVAELLDGTSVNMVFLNACASAREGEPDRPFYPFRGVAQACVNLGIRAALAMQVEILDSTAAKFAREFYASLADGEEVEKAILDARQLVGKADAADWAVPVLYSRVLEGSILAPELTRPPRSLWDWIQKLWKCITKNPVVVVLFGLVSALALMLGLFVDIQESRQPGGLLHSLWPAPTATPTPLPPMSEVAFNIAVAPFTTLDATGLMTVTQESLTLSNWLSRVLAEERRRLPATQAFEIRGPEGVKAIFGEDRDARDSNAELIAAHHNATMLIYGVVTISEEGHWVEPAFYVSHTSFGYGSELAGSERLGQKVIFTLPLDDPATLQGVNVRLNARAQALQRLVRGLIDLYFGYYVESEEALKQAILVEHWPPEEGHEVVHLLIGTVRLYRYDQDDDPTQLAPAFDAFSQAARLNPDYARSYLGLGAVALQHATSVKPADRGKLIEAQRWYSDALRAADKPLSAYVPVKVAFGLGELHLIGAKAGYANWSVEQAQRYFTQVVEAYEADRAPGLAWNASHAHAFLGQIANFQDDWPKVSSEYRSAVAILSALPGNPPYNWIARYWSQIGFAEIKRQRLDFAQDAYRQAIENGVEVVGSGTRAVSTEELEGWQDALDRLEGGVP
jgi:tetratricopeptide (TPR) repeat protein